MNSKLTGERLLLAAVFVAAALVDIPRLVRIGGLSGLALLSILVLTAGGLSLLAVPPRFAAVRAVRPFVLFFIWAAMTSLVHPPTGPGWQNLTVLAAFVVIVVVAAGEADRDPTLAPRIVTYGRGLVGGVSLLYVMSAGVGKFANSEFMGSRTYALVALIGLACLLVANGDESRSSKMKALLVVGVIGLSLSRLALAVALLLFFVARSSRRRPSGRRLVRIVCSAGLALVVMWFLIGHVPALEQRFFSGDQSLAVGGLQINASGRTDFWEATVDSWQTNPWTGHGAGSAGELIDSQFPGLGHPHNEYLRLLHDYGIVGLAFWVWGLLSILAGCWRRWHRADRRLGGVHQAAALGLLAMLAAMLTDNVIVYLFFMGPLGALVGASLGSDRKEIVDGAAEAAGADAAAPAAGSGDRGVMVRR